MEISTMNWISAFSILVFATFAVTEDVGNNGSDVEPMLEDVAYFGPRYVEEGTRFTIMCRLQQPLHLKWSKNGVAIKEEDDRYEQTLPFRNATYQVSNLTVHWAEAEHTGRFSCYRHGPLSHAVSVVFDVVTNEKNRGEGFVLNFAQPFLLLHCNASYDRMVNISWFKNGSPLDLAADKYTVFRENNTVKINSPVEVDTGEYTCAVEGDMSRNVSIQVRSRPRLKGLVKSANLVQDDKLKLHCEVIGGYPVPTVTWRKDNVTIAEPNATSHIKLLPDDKNVSNAILVIEHLQEDDRALYTCYAANSAGSVNTTAMVRVKDKLAALWPFLGILAEVAILCTIIFIYEKRRAKQEYEESDTDQNNESKPVGDQKEKDVRQRK